MNDKSEIKWSTCIHSTTDTCYLNLDGHAANRALWILGSFAILIGICVCQNRWHIEEILEMVIS